MAWKVLQSPETRKNYDSLYSQFSLMKESAGLPVQAELKLEDFTFDRSDSDNTGSDHLKGSYWFPCRCGGSYVLDSLAALCKAQFVPCSDCSLVVRILYPS
ncbi:unnamed protein product [Calicophoron daubneyi]|uniref:DPH-type MB domain-containing protein n=1 Tax=Calicophoron daubneyi TaxID=300641 RepID=A0AAV2TYU3_CALDB